MYSSRNSGFVKCICHWCHLHLPLLSNAFATIVKCICHWCQIDWRIPDRAVERSVAVLRRNNYFRRSQLLKRISDLSCSQVRMPLAEISDARPHPHPALAQVRGIPLGALAPVLDIAQEDRRVDPAPLGYINIEVMQRHAITSSSSASGSA